MKKIISSNKIIAFFLLVLISNTSWACPKINRLTDYNCDGAIKVTFTGDSITYGRGDFINDDAGGFVLRLNNKYPEGREDGKIVTVGDSAENKGFFAYNYGANPGTWYYLGTIGSAEVSAIAAEENEDETLPELAQSLPNNGLWFVIKTKE
jgi:hypothetical protein